MTRHPATCCFESEGGPKGGPPSCAVRIPAARARSSALLAPLVGAFSGLGYEVGERRATDIPPSEPYRAGHHRRVSSRPLPHRACGFPAHEARSPGQSMTRIPSRHPVGEPSKRSRPNRDQSGHRGLGHTALVPADVRDPDTHAQLQVLRWGRLCCPRPSSLLLPALTSAAREDRFVGCTYRPRLLPGTTGWQARGHQTAVRRRISPVPCSAVRTFRSPYAGRFFQAASPRSSPVPWPSPCRKGLGSASFLRERWTCYDAAGFASSYGPHARSTPKGAFVVTLRRFGSLLTPATSYTAAWSPPWPDLHRLVEHSFQDALRPQVCRIQRHCHPSGWRRADSQSNCRPETGLTGLPLVTV